MHLKKEGGIQTDDEAEIKGSWAQELDLSSPPGFSFYICNIQVTRILIS